MRENKKRRAKKHVRQSQPTYYIQHQSLHDLLGLIAPNMYNINYECTAAVIRDFHIATDDPWPVFLSDIALSLSLCVFILPLVFPSTRKLWFQCMRSLHKMCIIFFIVFTVIAFLFQVLRAASPALLRVIALGAFFIYCTVSVSLGCCFSFKP